MQLLQKHCFQIGQNDRISAHLISEYILKWNKQIVSETPMQSADAAA